MASTHIYPNTMTRLAGELTGAVRSMRQIDADLPQLKAILDQIAAGGDWVSLATELGYTTAAEAETAYNLIGSLVYELENSSPFWKQVISRMG
jgi:hypothetical protein